ncbi:MAG TPA: hypothetical protein VMH50_09655 [Thermoleophilia bacterium]|nr:hypothetical protein [Thermoleophilia bacterium]
MADRGSVVGGSSYSNFAGIFLFVVGLFNILDGVMTLWRKEYFQGADVVVANLQTWGWAVLVVGVVQLLAGWLVLNRSSVGRWVGVIIVVISMMVSFLAIGVYPFWTLIILLIDTLVLWGLTGRWES